MPRLNRGAIALHSAGITTAPIAAHYGLTTSAVTTWLAGRGKAPADFLEVVETLAGKQAAVTLAEIVTLREPGAVAS
jgi:hypothetical protein